MTKGGSVRVLAGMGINGLIQPHRGVYLKEVYITGT